MRGQDLMHGTNLVTLDMIDRRLVVDTLALLLEDGVRLRNSTQQGAGVGMQGMSVQLSGHRLH